MIFTRENRGGSAQHATRAKEEEEQEEEEQQQQEEQEQQLSFKKCRFAGPSKTRTKSGFPVP